MKIIKQAVTYCTYSQEVKCVFVEHDVLLENSNEYIIDEPFCGDEHFQTINKPHAARGGHTIGEIWSHESNVLNGDFAVTVKRYKLEDDEHDFDFYEIASREFANFESTKDLWVNRNGEIEPRRSEVA